jgi:hypothetical protein
VFVPSGGGPAISDSTETIVDFTSERYDTDSMHDNGTNPSRLTCVTAGVYRVTANAEWAVNITGIRRIEFLVNGTTVIASDQVGGLSGQAVRQTLVTDWKFAAGDYVQLRVYQTSGGSLTLQRAASYAPEMSMAYVGSGA